MAVGATFTYISYKEIYICIVMAIVIGGAYALFMVLSSTNVVMRMNHAKEVATKTDHPHLWNSVENLAMVARIPQPKIYIINDPSPNVVNDYQT